MFPRNRALATAIISTILLTQGFPALAANCGDTTSARGRDVVCRCGDTVTTNTRLVKKDPVVRKACPADGLHVADGITLDLGGQSIIGSRTGIGVIPGDGSDVLNGTIRNFTTGVAVNRGTVDLTDVATDANADSGLVISPSAGSTPEATFGGSLASASDNGGPGIVVAAGAELEITGASVLAKVLVLRNGEVGIEARGRLTATHVKVGQNFEHGVLVESADRVEFVSSQLNDNGRHPAGGNPGQAGALVLSAPDEFIWRGTASVVRDNSGHGFVLGHAANQSGIVIGRVVETQIYANDIGIYVEQKNADSLSTTSTIMANNIYANRGSGVYLKTSYQGFLTGFEALAGPEGFAIGFNDIHRNAVTPLETNVCVHEQGARQFASQMVFDGPVATTDLEFAAETGPDPVAYPEDYTCYWGPEPGSTPVSDPETCVQLGFPDESDPANVPRGHCAWLPGPGQCRVAWDTGGRENTTDNQCESPRNRIWNYTVEPIGSQLLHGGIAAINGAHVRARRNQVGRGGESDFAAVDSGLGSFVDPGRICGVEVTCDQYDQLPRD